MNRLQLEESLQRKVTKCKQQDQSQQDGEDKSSTTKYSSIEEEVYAMIREAVSIEEEFITESLPCALLGMNATSMKQYIRFVADRLIVDLGYQMIYHEKNPFKFMDHIALEGKNNFFENRTSEYQKASVLNTNQTSNAIFQESDLF